MNLYLIFQILETITFVVICFKISVNYQAVCSVSFEEQLKVTVVLRAQSVKENLSHRI